MFKQNYINSCSHTTIDIIMQNVVRLITKTLLNQTKIHMHSQCEYTPYSLYREPKYKTQNGHSIGYSTTLQMALAAEVKGSCKFLITH